MHEMVEHITVCDLSPAISPQQSDPHSVFGKTELRKVLAHSWVRWIVTTTNVGMRHSLTVLQTALQGRLEAPGVCPTDSAEYTFQLTLQYLCDSALRWGMWIFLDDYRVPVGMGNREYIPCNLTCPTSWQGKWTWPLGVNRIDTLLQIHSGSWTLVTIFPCRVNTEAFSEWSQKWTNKPPRAYDKGSTKGIYFNRGLIT